MNESQKNILWWLIYLVDLVGFTFSVSLSHQRSTQFLSKLNPLSYDGLTLWIIKFPSFVSMHPLVPASHCRPFHIFFFALDVNPMVGSQQVDALFLVYVLYHFYGGSLYD